MSRRAKLDLDFTGAIDITTIGLRFPAREDAPDLPPPRRAATMRRRERRPRRTPEARRTGGQVAELEAMLASTVYAELVDLAANSCGGFGPGRRPTTTPAALVVAVLGRAVWRTERAAFRELRDPRQWSRLRGFVRVAYPRRPELWLPDACPSRDSHRRAQARLDSAFTARLVEMVDTHARDVHRLVVSAPGDRRYTRPTLANVVYGDATWVRSRRDLDRPGEATDPNEGEIWPGGPLHPERLKAPTDSTRRRPRGTYVVTMAARQRSGGERTLLSTEVVPPGKSDGEVFVDWLVSNTDQLPTVTIAVYDMALQAVHAEKLLSAGIVPMVKVPRTKGGRPDTANLGVENFKTTDGRVEQHTLFTLDGWAGLVMNAAARSWFIPLTRGQVRRRGSALYIDVTVPDLPHVPRGLRGATALLRLNSTAKERAAGIHRAAHLRAFPEGDPVFQELYGVREDAESHHHKFQMHLWGRRARTSDPDHNAVDRAVWQLLENTRAVTAMTGRLARESTGPPLAA